MGMPHSLQFCTPASVSPGASPLSVGLVIARLGDVRRDLVQDVKGVRVDGEDVEDVRSGRDLELRR